MEYKKEDENEKRKFMKTLKQTTPRTVNYQKNSLGEIHYNILENIMFPKGSLSKLYEIVANWIEDIRTKIIYDRKLHTQNHIT